MTYRPILCLDFDGVLHSYTSGWQGVHRIPDDPVPGAFPFVLGALADGWDVVIHSSRSATLVGRLAIERWLRKHGAQHWEDTPEGQPGLRNVRILEHKPPAVVTIDDRALTFDGTWPPLQDLKGFKPWNKK